MTIGNDESPARTHDLAHLPLPNGATPGARGDGEQGAAGRRRAGLSADRQFPVALVMLSMILGMCVRAVGQQIGSHGAGFDSGGCSSEDRFFGDAAAEDGKR